MLLGWARHRAGLERPSPIEAPSVQTIEAFKNQRIRGPPPRAKRGDGLVAVGCWLILVLAVSPSRRLLPTRCLTDLSPQDRHCLVQPRRVGWVIQPARNTGGVG